MIQTSVAALKIEPGRAWEWRVNAGRTGTATLPGYSQAARLRHAPGPCYLAGTFPLPGPVDLDALEAALLLLVRRHAALRTRFDAPTAGIVTAPGDVTLTRTDAGPLASVADVRAYLHTRFQRVDAVGGPLLTLGAIVREDSATVHVALDQLIGDVVSTAIAAADITAAYHAIMHGRRTVLPRVGGYPGFGRAERELNERLRADDVRLDHWKRFWSRTGGSAPVFPLDLGIEPGERRPAADDTDQLLPDREAAVLEARCRDSGGGLFPGLLAAVAMAVRAEGGPAVYRALLPLDRRGRGHYAGAMGWFVNAVPIEPAIPYRTDLADAIARTGDAYEAARTTADVHHLRARELLVPPGRPAQGPVSFLSYLDFRKVPGAHIPDLTSHVWTPYADGIYLWLYRDATGLHLHARYPDTPRAGATKTALVRTLARTLSTLVG